MERIDTIVGNVHADDELATLRATHEENGTLERVVIDAENRRRSRFRATTDGGTDLGVVVDAPTVAAGDVLLVEDDRMIVIAFEPREAIGISLPEASPEAVSTAIELGHRLGNRHWGLAVTDGVAYVPLEADQHIIERVITDVAPDADIRKTTVDADLFVTDREEGNDGHAHGGEHDHEHTHDGGHQHKRGLGHTSHDTDHQHSHTRDHQHGTEHDYEHDGNTDTHDT
ncbi:urease accessory protein UreE [Natrialba asiatica]|uniref:Urease accessory protein UreE n=1 Tax=Natrialba asiatica (strain ATCC 700177 / DSM 12278 / JCM 9576 / FERM P-10747 / NBRC 102637 / 172P1) TaxID=29540 RepID=M0B767_NATA1|nr:urease accessory protein UreE [Natrialba asiatica]ELZ05479.1 urease accessory protein UreE [Natrialba asiatica DSM 12278]